jgi:hypothetical protein
MRTLPPQELQIAKSPPDPSGTNNVRAQLGHVSLSTIRNLSDVQVVDPHGGP